MREQEEDREVIATIGKRIDDVFTRTLSEEMTRASRQGVPTDTFLQGALNALLQMSAVTACSLISPENDRNVERVQARIDRLQVALSQALHRIIESELGATDSKGHV